MTLPKESGCSDHKYCCISCDDYTKKGSCMFITRLAESKFCSITDPSSYENGEGIFLNADDRNMIGCIGCLSHSAIRPLPATTSDYNETQLVRLMESEYERGIVQSREKMMDEFKWMRPICFGKHDAICDTRCAWVVRQRCIESDRHKNDESKDVNK
jgi:hypothetical protein